MPRKGESKNQFKKRMDKGGDSESKPINTHFDWDSSAVVFIEKNIGNCYTGRVVYTENDSISGEIRIAFARKFGAKGMLERTRTRLGLVSISTIKLSSGCNTVLEEMLSEKHLKVYLKEGLINYETYDKLFKNLSTSSAEEIDGDDKGGFVFADDSDSDSESSDEDDGAHKKPKSSGRSKALGGAGAVDDEVDIDAI